MGCCQKKKPDSENKEKTEPLNGKGNKNASDEAYFHKEISLIETNNEENDQTLTVKVSYSDFQPLKLLGRGSFGEVLLVRLKATGKIYAMKILDKKILKIKKQQNHTKTERDLMVKINCPFIVNIKSAFQDDTNLYLVSEFMQGGDMFFHLHDGQIIIFSNEKTKFYMIELVLALVFLHKNNMVYRDLKPENILLDSEGHVNLRQGYDKMVDWWSLGCVMYEMLCGCLPFAIKRGLKLSMKIYEKKIVFPKNIDKNAKDLIEKLLVVNPKNRIGYGPNGSEDIKNHPFFNGVDWDLAFEKKLTPPFVPKLKSDVDLRYFDNMFTDEPIGGPKRKVTIRDRDREPSNEYKGFTYMAESVSKELNHLANNDDPE